MSNTHEVTLSNGEKLQVSEEKSLLEAFREAGIYVKSSCGGVASCSDCLVKVTSGEDNLNSPSFEETKLIGNVFHITKERLSCQTKVNGPVSIDISNHDKTEDSKKLQEKNKKFIKPKGPIKKRSREEVKAMYDDRKKMREEKEEKRNQWQKHWEREDDQRAKGTGGNKRPKTFRTDQLEDNDTSSGTSKNTKES